MATKGSYHVHFLGDEKPENPSLPIDGRIVLPTRTENNEAFVNLGFLKINHRYSVNFSMNLNEYNFNGKFEPMFMEPPNVNCKVLEINETSEGVVKMTLEVIAHKIKLWEEIVILRMVDEPERTLKMLVQARVLAKEQGTPCLKTGVTCTQVAVEEDSDASDWQPGRR